MNKHIMVLMSLGASLSGLPAIVTSAVAFSPYETYLLSGQDTRVGLIAKAESGREMDVKNALVELHGAPDMKSFAKAGIRNLASFSRIINSQTYFFVYFEYAGNKQYSGAVEAFESASPKVAGLSQWTSSVAGINTETGWTQMEWISFIRGRNIPGKPQNKLSLVTTLRRDKELQYRNMHQTIWPGVIDQMIRGNNRNFSAFVCEMEGELYEFIYVEYVGSNAEKDHELNQKNSVNQRWWKLTDACQKPLPGENSIWASLELVSTDQ